MVRNILLLSAMLSLLSCASKPWQSMDNPPNIMLPDVQVIAGEHCESSAIINALNYLDYSFNEADVVGGGGAIGFMYQRGEFPFLGGRNFTLREIFFKDADLVWQKNMDQNAEESWQGVIDVLKKGIPVVLRVDMRYLPYLYGGKYGSSYMSFGWHIITLFGINFENETALISDTAHEGLQSIKLKDLEKARSSDTKVFPPLREYYWIEPKPKDYNPDWNKILKESIREVINNYEWKPVNQEESDLGLGGLEGLRKFEQELKGFESTVSKTYLLSPIFDYLYGSIETNGTGGAAFRIFYRDFLLQMSDRLNNPKLKEAAALLDTSIVVWHKLASDFKRISQIINKVKSKEERSILYTGAAEIAVALYNAEKTFYLYIRDEL
jgi:Domain of unknown function (DUF4872)/Butirosin biosynthesis protein H, N-terminal